jgi:hypothetical protein
MKPATSRPSRVSFGRSPSATSKACVGSWSNRSTSTEPDGDLQRAVLQCSDPEATAWAWAAGQYLGLQPKAIIQDDEYGGDGSFLRLQLATGGYVGINGLSHAGFCAVRPDRSTRR